MKPRRKEYWQQQKSEKDKIHLNATTQLSYAGVTVKN
jgi:hypothetical protein